MHVHAYVHLRWKMIAHVRYYRPIQWWRRVTRFGRGQGRWRRWFHVTGDSWRRIKCRSQHDFAPFPSVQLHARKSHIDQGLTFSLGTQNYVVLWREIQMMRSVKTSPRYTLYKYWTTSTVWDLISFYHTRRKCDKIQEVHVRTVMYMYITIKLNRRQGNVSDDMPPCWQ